MCKEYVDINKMIENTRILALNPNSINPWDNIQMNMLTHTFENKQIDITMLNETNVKWILSNIDKIEKELK